MWKQKKLQDEKKSVWLFIRLRLAST